MFDVYEKLVLANWASDTFVSGYWIVYMYHICACKILTEVGIFECESSIICMDALCCCM